MRMMLHTDYALRMLVHLAVSKGRPTTVNDVAESYGISRNHLLKVALALKNLGFVATARGRSGGIRLARATQDISIGEVVRKLGGEFPVVECMKAGGRGCVLSPACRLKGIIHEALGSYLRVFDKYSLADLVVNGDDMFALLGSATQGADAPGRAA